MTEDELLELLKEENHWRVTIRPTQFDDRRIGSLGECLALVEENQVRSRGWYYPHVQHDYRKTGVDYIQSGFPRKSEHLEAWRLHQSGQFVQYFVLFEDYIEVPWISSAFAGGKPQRYLEVISFVYRVSEIFEFAARLAARNVLDPAAVISITLTGLASRALVFWDMSRYLLRGYISSQPELSFEREYAKEELLARSRELALEACAWFLERFGWLNPSMDVFAEDQRRLFERSY